ncbi:unnamed protein product, partial [Ectocarpus sp. 12 AP-2014]
VGKIRQQCSRRKPRYANTRAGGGWTPHTQEILCSKMRRTNRRPERLRGRQLHPLLTKASTPPLSARPAPRGRRSPKQRREKPIQQSGYLTPWVSRICSRRADGRGGGAGMPLAATTPPAAPPLCIEAPAV